MYTAYRYRNAIRIRISVKDKKWMVLEVQRKVYCFGNYYRTSIVYQ